MTKPEEFEEKLATSTEPVPASKGSEKVMKYLKDRNLSFFHTTHPIAYTAQQAASVAHVSGNEFGKAVMVCLDDKDVVMCVLRAPDRVRLNAFAKAINATKADLCSDSKVRELTEHDMEAGALPPLPLFGVRIFMDTELAKDQLIHFCAGLHHEIITMYMKDYIQNVKPTRMALAEPIDIHLRELTRMLQKHKLGMPHGIIRHKATFTASEAAKETSVPGVAMIKSVVVKLDGKMSLCAVCATDVVDFEKLAKVAKVEKAGLASEEELKEHFHGVEVGAIPPFGRLFHVSLYIDEGVGSWPTKGDGDVIFSAGTHTESMIMRFVDYLAVNKKWNEPIFGKFARLDTGADHPWTSSHIKRYLRDQDVAFTSVMHSVAYTASEIAHAACISGHRLAKTVMVKVDSKLAMTVLQAADMLDLKCLKKLAGGKDVALAEETEFADVFAHVEPGAMPPFGQLYNMPTYVDTKLAGIPGIYMNAGTHKELLCLKWSDYNRIVSPIIGDLSCAGLPATPPGTPQHPPAPPDPEGTSAGAPPAREGVPTGTQASTGAPALSEAAAAEPPPASGTTAAASEGMTSIPDLRNGATQADENTPPATSGTIAAAAEGTADTPAPDSAVAAAAKEALSAKTVTTAKIETPPPTAATPESAK